ncbi:hypothetical protein GCM10027515_05460 [Schumannella luteola]|uniref:Uncharacterized protein n=1 Tax=Schumannella luteola TaxID=472059 RepID=A0A852YAU1_9MICO|nr:DUF6461 domain-containing protein [Schumannella luteola]NYG98321.1 hypothetical protein [Schumannella luteola]TPX05751.1 hypothetical protein FJ656_04795 [Schumannella luteola]
MTASASDYRWFLDYRLLVDYGYCAATVPGITPRRLLDLLEARGRATAPDLDSLIGASQDAFEIATVDRQLVGVRAIGTATLLLQANGWVGVTDELMRPVIDDHEVAAHFLNVNGVDRFHWWSGRRERLAFEPLAFSARHDLDDDVASETLAALTDAGFDLDDGDPDSPTASAWALAENLTGVRVTEDQLAGPWLTGVVTFPGQQR